MPYQKRFLMLLLFAMMVLLTGSAAAEDFFSLPALPPPEGYGTILINRSSVKKGLKPVIFSHWLHRTRYTCRVCHGELEFNMQANTTEITEFGNRKGRFCGACHNGKIAFKANGNCDLCHAGDTAKVSAKFSEVLGTSNLPRTEFGNGIDWQEALRRGMITPKNFLKNKSQDLPFDKLLVLDADWGMIPPAVFSHKVHTDWLDCSSCHPDIFNIKKKTTAHFSMARILRGDFCGACHISVAFPMNDCARCHPKKKDET